MFRNYASFSSELLLASRPTPKLQDQPLVVVCDCLFNILAATLHPQPEDMPCYGDRDPFIMGGVVLENTKMKK